MRWGLRESRARTDPNNPLYSSLLEGDSVKMSEVTVAAGYPKVLSKVDWSLLTTSTLTEKGGQILAFSIQWLNLALLKMQLYFSQLKPMLYKIIFWHFPYSKTSCNISKYTKYTITLCTNSYNMTLYIFCQFYISSENRNCTQNNAKHQRSKIINQGKQLVLLTQYCKSKKRRNSGEVIHYTGTALGVGLFLIADRFFLH
jgi:hypothetical protein